MLKHLLISQGFILAPNSKPRKMTAKNGTWGTSLAPTVNPQSSTPAAQLFVVGKGPRQIALDGGGGGSIHRFLQVLLVADGRAQLHGFAAQDAPPNLRPVLGREALAQQCLAR